MEKNTGLSDKSKVRVLTVAIHYSNKYIRKALAVLVVDFWKYILTRFFEEENFF